MEAVRRFWCIKYGEGEVICEGHDDGITEFVSNNLLIWSVEED